MPPKCDILVDAETQRARALEDGPLPVATAEQPTIPFKERSLLREAIKPALQSPGSDEAALLARARAQTEAMQGRPLDPEQVAFFDRAEARLKDYRSMSEAAASAKAKGDYLAQFSPGKQASMGWWEKHVGGPLWDKIFVEKIWNKLPAWLRTSLVVDPMKLPTDARAILEVGKAQERVIVEEAVRLKRMLSGEGLDGAGKKFTEEEARWVFWRAQGEKLPDMPGPRFEEMQRAALAARAALDNMGEMAVRVIPEHWRGVLKDEVFFKNYGRYMPYYYRRFLGPEGESIYKGLLSKYVKSAPEVKMVGKHFQARNLSSPIPGYALVENPVAAAKGFAEVGRDIVSYQMFEDMAANLQVSSALPRDGWKLIPEDARYGPMRGRWVEPETYAHIRYSFDQRGEAGKLWDSAMGVWKKGMTMLNPGSWGRNFMGALVTNGQGTGRTIFDPRLLSGWIRHAIDYNKGAGFWKEALEANAIDRAFFGEAVRSGMKEVQRALVEGEKRGWSLPTILSRTWGGIRDGYAAIDAINKLDIYAWAREKGWSIPEAAEHAKKFGIDWERAGSTIRWINRFPSPFITYSALAIPRYIEASVKRPIVTNLHAALFAGMSAYAARQWGWGNEDEERAAAIMPEWMHGRNMLKIPVELGGGKGVYWDATYLMPWQSMAGMWDDAGAQVKDRLFGNPLNAFVEVAFNKNLHSGRTIYRESDPADFKWNAIYTHIFRRLAPSLTPALPQAAGFEVLPGGYGAAKLRAAVEGRPDYNGRVRTIATTLADVGIGLSTIERNYDKERRRWIHDWRTKKEELKSSIARTRTDPTLRDDEKDARIKAYEKQLTKLQEIEIPEPPK